MSKLLMHEIPLMVQPGLAVKIGLNEAIFLQQLHYWLERSMKIIDNRKWVYNSAEEWHKQFPFWSIATIKRVISSLEKQDLIITGNYNKISIDRTKWYTINYLTIENLENNNLPDNIHEDIAEKSESSSKMNNSSNISNCTNEGNKGLIPTQNNKNKNSVNNLTSEPSNVSNCTNAKYQNEPTNVSNCTNAMAQFDTTNTNNNNIDYLQKNTTTYEADKATVVDNSNLKMKKKMLILIATRCGVQAKNMRIFFNLYAINSIEQQLYLLEKAIKKGNKIKNPAGWLHTALKQNYFDSELDLSSMQLEEQKRTKRIAMEREQAQRKALGIAVKNSSKEIESIEIKQDNIRRLKGLINNLSDNC